jgi:gluconolactonase
VEQLLTLKAAWVFYEGMLTDPQLDHPEGLAVGQDGSIWCGGERGQIYRIDPDGDSLEVVATTEGFCLGMAFDGKDRLYVCDVKHAAVLRLDTRTGSLEQFADGGDGHPLRVPNHPAFDAEGNLYVSDSHAFKEPGPGIFRFPPRGSGELWYDQPVNFANGLAISPDQRHLYVAETFANRIFRIPIGEDGSPGERDEVASFPGVLPDGLAFDVAGNLYVGCYEPSQVLRVDSAGNSACLVRDEEAHLLCHPTNLAFRGTTLFTANLGRWHISAIEVGSEGLPLGPVRL